MAKQKKRKRQEATMPKAAAKSTAKKPLKTAQRQRPAAATPTMMSGQMESSLQPRKIARDSIYILPALTASVVVAATGPGWLKTALAALDGLFALMTLAAVVVAVGIWQRYRRRHSLAIACYGLYSILLVGLAVLLFSS